MPAARWTRVAIVGASGTGKTELAKALSAALGLTHVSVDSLRWPAGGEVTDDELALALAHATDGDRWVVEGVDAAPPLQAVWSRVDAVLWLDHSRTWMFGRFLFGSSWGRRFDSPDGRNRRVYATYLLHKAQRSWTQAADLREALPPVLDRLRADGVDVVRHRSSLRTRWVRAALWRQARDGRVPADIDERRT